MSLYQSESSYTVAQACVESGNPEHWPGEKLLLGHAHCPGVFDPVLVVPRYNSLSCCVPALPSSNGPCLPLSESWPMKWLWRASSAPSFLRCSTDDVLCSLAGLGLGHCMVPIVRFGGSSVSGSNVRLIVVWTEDFSFDTNPVRGRSTI